MAKNDEKTNVPEAPAAATALYKVGYTYLSKEGFIRTGSIVCETTSAEKAKAEAVEKLASTTFRNIRIGKITTY